MQDPVSSSSKPQVLETAMRPPNVQSERDQLSVGRLVRQEIERLFVGNALDSEMLENLQDANYSKQVFGLRYPVLRPVATGNRFDEAGRARYYTKVYGDKFYLCNDWYERNRMRFLQWSEGIS